jgi:hypothetical protein
MALARIRRRAVFCRHFVAKSLVFGLDSDAMSPLRRSQLWISAFNCRDGSPLSVGT